MLEVVFGDSEKGLMKVAKQASSGGSSQDVVSIGFALDIGDISGEVDGNGRKKVFEKIWGCYDFNPQEAEEFFRAQRDDREKLLAEAEKGTPIRIWKSSAPYSVCAFAYVCDLLRNIHCGLSVIALPDYRIIEGNTLVSYAGWGELQPSELYGFLPLEKQISQMEKKYYGDIWRDLVAENAPLRATVNGKLLSVSDDFYDDIITKNIPDGDFVMARLIGHILGKYQLGIGDCWVALRIDKMIEDRRLIVICENDKSYAYGKILRKNI